MAEGLLSTGLTPSSFRKILAACEEIKFLPAVIGKVRKAKLYVFIGRLAKLHTVELGTSRLKGDGTNRNPLNKRVYLIE